MRAHNSVAIALVAAVATACSPIAPQHGGSGDALPGMRARLVRPASGSSSFMPIQHVVIIMQENRSFENLFAGYPGADAPMTAPMHDGTVVPLVAIQMNTFDVNHGYGDSINDYNGGKMNGFDQNYLSDGKQAGHFTLSYVRRDITAPYWAMARQYVLADAMFPTEHGPSWTAHLDIIASTTNLGPRYALVDFPTASPYDCSAPPGTMSSLLSSSGAYISKGPYPCFTAFTTMADTLDAAGVSWRFYAPRINGDIGGIWSPFGAIKNVRYGPDWSHVISRPPQVLSDIAAGKLAAVTWVTPEWNYSDHAGGGATSGPSWVAAVVNAVGESKFWNSTAVVVLWDDWGGFYDDAVPPQLDFKGLGIRVGCLIVSPYAKPGYVSHTQYEFGSVLKFVEEVFNLPPLGPASLGYTDSRANSIMDSFNFQQSPIIFQPIPAPQSGSFFLHLKPDFKPPDDE